jgi:hypothetical protein
LLLAAAALAAGLVSSQAQSNVYSVNIVGYINVTYTNAQLSFFADQLKPSNGDYNITNTVRLTDPGSDTTTLYKWNPGTSSWDPYGWIDGFGWFPDVNIPLGEGFFLQPVANGTLTFVGEVATGSLTNSFPTGNSVRANMVPVAARIPGFAVGNDTDTVYTWDRIGNQWVATGFIDGYGWFDGSAETNGPLVEVGNAIFYQNTGAALNWIQAFNP